MHSVFSLNLVCQLIWSLADVNNFFLVFLDNDLFYFTSKSIVIFLLLYRWR